MSNAPFFVEQERLWLSSNGVWYSDDTEITHEQTCKLFTRVLHFDGSKYWLEIGREKKEVEVKDTPYFVRRIDGNPSLGFDLTLNDGAKFPLNPKTLAYRPGRLTCHIEAYENRGFKGGFDAKFLSGPYFELLSHCEEDAQGYFLKIEGIKTPLAPKESA